MLEFIQRPGIGRGQQFEGLAERAGPRCGQDAFGVPRGIGGQQHGPFQECCGGGQAAACLRPAGRALQFDGDLLIWPRGGLGPVPGPPVRVSSGVGDRGQRGMRGAPRPGPRSTLPTGSAGAGNRTRDRRDTSRRAPAVSPASGSCPGVD